MSDKNKMLMIIDPQIDFIDGSLPVPGAGDAMDSLTDYLKDSDGDYKVKIITADRHPYNHFSFKDNGGPWPRHCIQDSVGAAIWPRLFDMFHATAGKNLILHKGETWNKEEYSIFRNDSAADSIRSLVAENDIRHIDICGLAGDVCVLDSLKDGMRIFPDVTFHVLERYSPSIDGGTKLSGFIEKLK